MKPARRKFLRLAAGAAALPAASRTTWAQIYPSHPITMIVPYTAGSDTDVLARVVAEAMTTLLGQAIVIENISGAEGSIGVGRAARARPDGYTIDFGGTSAHVLNGAFYSLQYDLLNNFSPILPIITTPLVLFARKTLPANNLNELIGWLRADPNKASAGTFSGASHLMTALFQRETGTQFTIVPYRGSAPAVQDLAAGQIDLLYMSSQALSLVRAGRIKPYAATSDTRLVFAPDIPTFVEMGLPTLTFSGWGGLFAPKGTPKEIIGRLNAAAVGALADPSIRSRLGDLGSEVFSRERQTPEALGALVKADAEKWWPLIKELGIKVQ